MQLLGAEKSLTKFVTDRQTHGHTDRHTRVKRYTPLSLQQKTVNSE